MQMEGVSRRDAIQTVVTGAALLAGAPAAFAQRAPGAGYPVKKKEVRMANANYAPVVSVQLGTSFNSYQSARYLERTAERLHTDHCLRPPWLRGACEQGVHRPEV